MCQTQTARCTLAAECTSQFVVGIAFWFGIDLISTVSSCEGETFFQARALPSLRLDPPGGRVFLLPSNFCRHQMPKRRVILCCRTCVVIHARGDSNFAVFDVPTLPLAGGSSLSEGRVFPCALRGLRPALRQKMCQLQTARCTLAMTPRHWRLRRGGDFPRLAPRADSSQQRIRCATKDGSRLSEGTVHVSMAALFSLPADALHRARLDHQRHTGGCDVDCGQQRNGGFSAEMHERLHGLASDILD